MVTCTVILIFIKVNLTIFLGTISFSFDRLLLILSQTSLVNNKSLITNLSAISKFLVVLVDDYALTKLDIYIWSTYIWPHTQRKLLPLQFFQGDDKFKVPCQIVNFTFIYPNMSNISNFD